MIILLITSLTNAGWDASGLKSQQVKRASASEVRIFDNGRTRLNVQDYD